MRSEPGGQNVGNRNPHGHGCRDDQTRQLAAVDLRSLPLWLATIEPSRVKPEARRW